MQPENINFQPEHSGQGIEQPLDNRGGLLGNPEVLPASGLEKAPDLSRERASVADSLASASPMTTVIPAPDVATIPSVVQTHSLATPEIAGDDDNMSAEWVKIAQDIVGRNRNDPHAQGNETAELKADYQKKRFNRDVGSSSEAS